MALIRIISHRGNLNGPSPDSENRPDQIEKILDLGFDCEIDLHFYQEKFYLGHDKPTYSINKKWLETHSEHLWVHCKTFDTLNTLAISQSKLNFFWHQEDDHVITSHGQLWTYPGKPVDAFSIAVLPESISGLNDLDFKLFESSYGICTDFPAYFMEHLA
ncbi:MAG: hypothetical protein NTZ31_05930 [Actinobacteria bacterium]|nr:hypothetical protein [Actinomycetota bacterium]